MESKQQSEHRVDQPMGLAGSQSPPKAATLNPRDPEWKPALELFAAKQARESGLAQQQIEKSAKAPPTFRTLLDDQIADLKHGEVEFHMNLTIKDRLAALRKELDDLEKFLRAACFEIEGRQLAHNQFIRDHEEAHAATHRLLAERKSLAESNVILAAALGVISGGFFVGVCWALAVWL